MSERPFSVCRENGHATFRWLIVAPFFALGGLWLIWSQVTPSTLDGRQVVVSGGLIVDEAALNVGDVWLSNDFIVDLPIRNPTSQDKEIRAFSLSCDCTAIEPSALIIPAGEVRMVKAHVNLLAVVDNPPALQTDFSTLIVPLVANTALRQNGWRLRGRVMAPFRETPSRIQFAEQLYGTSPVTEKIILEPIEGVEGVDIRCEHDASAMTTDRNATLDNLRKVGIYVPHSRSPND